MSDVPPSPPVAPTARATVEPGYLDFARRLTASGILGDPWLEGRPRFRARPVVLRPSTATSLRNAAEHVAACYHELALLLAQEPALVERIYRLTPFQRLMWQASAPAWHGIARADVFLTATGPAVCEINCDTPSGEAEAVLLNAAVQQDHPRLVDPNAELGARFVELLAEVAASLRVPVGRPTIGILYPTELTEDLSMIRLYRAWCEARGWRVVLGAPFNLTASPDGRACLFGTPIDVFVRHYKTDWWGEREPVWRGEPPPPDAEPLAAELGVLLRAVLDGTSAVVNPFGAVLLQNKRTMAALWELRDRFPLWAQDAIRRHVPLTARLETLDRERLTVEKDLWVLKSDYGCEGAEVVLGVESTPELWAEALRQAIPERWVAQRYFHTLPDEDGALANIGVYLVAGLAAGFYTRLQRGATDCYAVSAPTFVESPVEESRP